MNARDFIVTRLAGLALIVWVSATAAVARQQPTTPAAAPILYEIGTDEYYHLGTCATKDLYKLVPVRPIDVKDRRLKPCLACRPMDSPAVRELMASTPESNVVFTTAVAMTMRSGPDAKAKVVGTMPAGSLATVLDIQPGWAKVDEVGGADRRGWVAATSANLAARGLLEAIGIHLKLEETTWPAATRAAILKGDVKIGFTTAQVLLALGEPTTKVTEETAKGIVTVWQYRSTTLVIVGGRVQSIRKVE